MASCSRIVRDETYRVGLEVYYTGRQELEHNPYRRTSGGQLMYAPS